MSTSILICSLAWLLQWSSVSVLAFNVGGSGSYNVRHQMCAVKALHQSKSSDGHYNSVASVIHHGAVKRRHRMCAKKRSSDDDDGTKSEDIRNIKNDILNKHSRLSLAPMMEYTNRHFRTMIRLISNNILTYSEMVAAEELLSGRRNSNVKHELLGQSSIIPEGPSVLQLGGNDVEQLYNCAKIYHDYSKTTKSKRCEYTALNLNCGCPSPSVSGKKCFGAALMRDPNHVAKIVRAMHDGVEGELPITVKCRVGLYDNTDEIPFTREAYDKQSNEKEYDQLCRFIETIANDGIVTSFQIHARIAILGGTFSAADNRKIPPLKYEYVHRLCKDFPELNFVSNGGIRSLEQAKNDLEGSKLSGIMVGRAMVADPWSFGMADQLIYEDDIDNQQHICANRKELLEVYGRHSDYEEQQNEPAAIRRSLVAACAHLFAGETNSKQFRMELDEIAGRPERLERERKAKAWSSGSSTASGGGSALTSAFAVSSSTTTTKSSAVGWDDIQAIDNTRPTWDANEPPLSELILEAAHKHFGYEILNLSRKESYDKKIWEDDMAKRKVANGKPILSVTSSGDEKVSGGVVDGWFNNVLD